MNEAFNKAKELSKSNNHKEALEIFINQKTIPINFHKQYAWCIYKYLKDKINTISIDGFKSLLFAYTKLTIAKPSLLNSLILRLAVSRYKNNKDFNLYKFVEIFDASTLRKEDFQNSFYQGEEFRSLFKNLLEAMVLQNIFFDIKILQNILNFQDALEQIREVYFWEILKTNKNKNYNLLWKIFDFYAINFSSFGASYYHSEILRLANDFMSEQNLFRFINFLKKWKVENFRKEDYEPRLYKDMKFTPIVIRSAKNAIDSQINSGNNDYLWLIDLCENILKKVDDIWLKRDYANLLVKTKNKEKALKIYLNLILHLNDKFYIWNEISYLVNDENLVISMLCNALILKQNEDFLGDIHLRLANFLFKTHSLKEAKTELLIYKEHRIKKGWKIDNNFDILFEKLSEIKAFRNNKKFYYKNTKLARNYIYEQIPKDQYKKTIALVDHVNIDKKIFHYVADDKTDGIISFNQTSLRPKVKDIICIKTIKLNKQKNKVIDIKISNERPLSLVKDINGKIKLSFKKNNCTGYPDFGFIGNYYIPREILLDQGITKDCQAKAKAVFLHEKWQVIEIELSDRQNMSKTDDIIS